MQNAKGTEETAIFTAQIARDILVIKGKAIVVAVRKEGQGGDSAGREL